MKKKKKRAKPQPPRLFAPLRSRRHSRLLLWHSCLYSNPTSNPITACRALKLFIPLLLISLLQIGCTALPYNNTKKVSYANLPNVGTWLPAQRELVACKTKAAARYMSDLGFFHHLCIQLTDIGPRDYLVKKREKVELLEGPMWLLHAANQGQIVFVPIPWHNWF